MMSKLLNRDPKEVTQSRAAAVWLAEINRMVRSDGLSLSDAWNQLRETEPELHARISDKTDAAADALENGDGTPQRPALPRLSTQKPFIARAFRLPVDVDDGVLNAAWVGNGSQSVRVDADKVFHAIATYLMKTKGCNVEAARSQMCDDYPELCRYCKQMPDQATAAAGSSGNK